MPWDVRFDLVIQDDRKRQMAKVHHATGTPPHLHLSLGRVGAADAKKVYTSQSELASLVDNRWLYAVYADAINRPRL